VNKTAAFKKIIAISLLCGLTACASKPKKMARLAVPETSETKPSCSDDHPALECAKAPSAAFDKDGRLWVVWEQGGKIYLNHSNDFGNHFSPPVAVTVNAETIQSGGEARPKLALAKAGGIYLAWTGSGNIRFSRSLDGGKTFATPLRVGVSQPHLEALAVNDRDHLYLAWLEGSSLLFSLSSDGGRSFHPPQALSEDACRCCRIAMKIDSKKFPAIAWQQASGAVSVNHFRDKEQPGSVQTFGDSGKECAGPALSISPQGDYYAAWADRFSASFDHGKTFTPAARLEAATHPDVVADEHSVHRVWQTVEAGKTAVLEQFSLDGGQSWSAPKRLAETEGTADYPFLLAHQGRHYVVWQTAEQGFRLINIGD
jgi:hypothetical protein